MATTERSMTARTRDAQQRANVARRRSWASLITLRRRVARAIFFFVTIIIVASSSNSGASGGDDGGRTSVRARLVAGGSRFLERARALQQQQQPTRRPIGRLSCLSVRLCVRSFVVGGGVARHSRPPRLQRR